MLSFEASKHKLSNPNLIYTRLNQIVIIIKTTRICLSKFSKLAVFDIAFNFDDDESEENERPKVEVSFAEDATRLRCPISVRNLLTQSDYVLRAEQGCPRTMEEMLLEREKERRKRKPKPIPITFTDE